MPHLDKKTAVIIPIRMSSTRLPGKFHADINGKAMIHHVIDRARESKLSNIFVACDHEDHFKLITDYGAKAVMTSVDHQSGSDRSHEAMNIIDPEGNFEYIVNLQGDMPFFDPEVIRATAQMLENDQDADISTMVSLIDDEDDIKDPNVVKVIFNKNKHALYFSRLPIPYPMDNKKADYFYHVGIYAYRREAIKKYVSLPQSSLELSEKLEQLRALENGMKICIETTKTITISVDNHDDLMYARDYASKCNL
jgi:3-deoxy-manno-octulosonate cytidylyltransferase (CMP-KDO synthetase)